MEKKFGLVFSSEKPLLEHLGILTSKNEKSTSLAGYSIFEPFVAKSLNMKNIVLNFKESSYAKNLLIDRAIGSLMAQAMGDSIGSQNETPHVDYNAWIIPDFDEKYFTKRDMKAGNITDDTAMAQCLADSLILKKGFDPIDFMKRISLWWFYGYNNFTGLGSEKPKVSHGMGSTSRGAMFEFIDSKYTISEAINKNRASNGCIMRLAPVALYYHDDVDKAMKYAVQQAKCTHSCKEAEDSSIILAYLIVKALNYSQKFEGQKDFGQKFLNSLDFEEVKPLLKVPDANLLIKAEGKWNWRQEKFTFPLEHGGFLALDGLAMALHCMYTGKDPTHCLLKCVNFGGDADTVAAITGQIIGALYGISAFPAKWCEYILKWDREGEIALKSILLIKRSI